MLCNFQYNEERKVWVCLPNEDGTAGCYTERHKGPVKRRCGNDPNAPKRRHPVNAPVNLITTPTEFVRAGEKLTAAKYAAQKLQEVRKLTFRQVVGFCWEMGKFLAISAYHRKWMIRERQDYLRVRAICESCPHDLWDAEGEKCKDCGCGGRPKISLYGLDRINLHDISTKRCPKGEW